MATSVLTAELAHGPVAARASRPRLTERVAECLIVSYAILAGLQPVLPTIPGLDMHISTALAVALWPLAAVYALQNLSFCIVRRKLLLLLILTFVARIILSPGDDLRDRFVMGSVMITFLAITLLCSHPRVQLPNGRLLWAIVLGGTAVGALRLAQYYGQLWWLHPSLAARRTIRVPEFAVRGLYDDLVPVLALAAAMALLARRRAPSARWRAANAVVWLALPVNLAAAMCAGSRIFALASVLVTIGCAAAGAVLGTMRPWAACLGAMVMVGSLALGAAGFVRAGAPLLTRLYAPAVEPRAVEMAVELEMIEQSPLLGAGVYPRYDPRIFFGTGIVYGHNTYTGWAAKVGIPWTLSLVVLLVWITCRLWRLSRRGEPAARAIYLAGAVQFTVLLLAVQWVTNPLQMSATAPLLGAFAGAALRGRYVGRARNAMETGAGNSGT